jgi:hypothetical protein
MCSPLSRAKTDYTGSAGNFKIQCLYGYVIAATGTKRNGWMAHDALEVSSGCP